ncbi:cell division protein CrgA [uncultured Nocardioides sp.]|uniref:cell division protein CrgA n=1 Tax=uncultured Nocardioides sp. TaxID=198441 RepID=UPI0026082A69|nr:cell division protein CrgA [uncultured Nocardioides sp.]
MSDEKADKTTDDETPTGSTTPAAAAAPVKRTTATSKGASGNPAKAGRTAGSDARVDKKADKVADKKAARSARRPQQEKLNLSGNDPLSGRVWRSPRFVLGTVMALGGIAWLVFYYLRVRPDGTGAEPGGPAFMGDLGQYNYLIGFGLIMVGLVVLAHKSTPLGRGRGVVVGMLGCFLVGLLWICTFYVITDDLSAIPVFNDLGQFNLMVGIAFMAVGFTFATKWE